MNMFKPVFWPIILGMGLIFCMPLSAKDVAKNAKFTITDNDKQIVISVNKKPFALYQYKDVPFKPYIKELYTPSGYNLLLDAPKDHLHHHGLMFALSVDGVSFWEETEKGGKEVDQGDLSSFANEKEAGFTRTLQWITPEKKVVLIEKKNDLLCV